MPVTRIDLVGLADVDPCAAAKEKLKPDPTEESGALVCHDGKLTPCVWNKDKPLYTEYPGILACAQAHEDEHKKQSPDVKCEPCKTYYVIGDPKATAEGECAAYGAELECLKKAQKAACGTGYDPKKDIGEMTLCELAFWSVISSTEHHQATYCGAKFGGE
jgi:hypothetical protein